MASTQGALTLCYRYPLSLSLPALPAVLHAALPALAGYEWPLGLNGRLAASAVQLNVRKLLHAQRMMMTTTRMKTKKDRVKKDNRTDSKATLMWPRRSTYSGRVLNICERWEVRYSFHFHFIFISFHFVSFRFISFHFISKGITKLGHAT